MRSHIICSGNLFESFTTTFEGSSQSIGSGNVIELNVYIYNWTVGNTKLRIVEVFGLYPIKEDEDS